MLGVKICHLKLLPMPPEIYNLIHSYIPNAVTNYTFFLSGKPQFVTMGII
jgi:hypothetical protein